MKPFVKNKLHAVKENFSSSKDRLKKLATKLAAKKIFSKALVSGTGHAALSVGVPGTCMLAILGAVAAPVAAGMAFGFAALGGAGVVVGGRMSADPARPAGKLKKFGLALADTFGPVALCAGAFALGVALAGWPVLTLVGAGGFGGISGGIAYYRHRYGLKETPPPAPQTPEVKPEIAPEVQPQPPKLEAGIKIEFAEKAEKPSELAAEKPAEPKPVEPPKL